MFLMKYKTANAIHGGKKTVHIWYTAGKKLCKIKHGPLRPPVTPSLKPIKTQIMTTILIMFFRIIMSFINNKIGDLGNVVKESVESRIGKFLRSRVAKIYPKIKSKYIYPKYKSPITNNITIMRQQLTDTDSIEKGNFRYRHPF